MCGADVAAAALSKVEERSPPLGASFFRRRATKGRLCSQGRDNFPQAVSWTDALRPVPNASRALGFTSTIALEMTSSSRSERRVGVTPIPP